MIDFSNSPVVKLSQVTIDSIEKTIAPLLIEGENVISAYKSVRDFVCFTNKRVISVNVQGFTGKKKDFTSMPYAKISVFAVETAGTFDLDSELEMYFSGVGKVKFEFTGNSDIVEISRLIAGFCLK